MLEIGSTTPFAIWIGSAMVSCCTGHSATRIEQVERVGRRQANRGDAQSPLERSEARLQAASWTTGSGTGPLDDGWIKTDFSLFPPSSFRSLSFPDAGSSPSHLNMLIPTSTTLIALALVGGAHASSHTFIKHKREVPQCVTPHPVMVLADGTGKGSIRTNSS